MVPVNLTGAGNATTGLLSKWLEFESEQDSEMKAIFGKDVEMTLSIDNSPQSTFVV